jgi:hypothetical protein
MSVVEWLVISVVEWLVSSNQKAPTSAANAGIQGAIHPFAPRFGLG